MILADDVVYRMFLDPLPIWSNPYIWPQLLLPLCAGVAVVYKCIRCDDMARVPREAAGLFLTIIVGMVATAGALAGLAALMR